MRRASRWRRGRHFWYRRMLRKRRRGGSQSRYGASRVQSGTSAEMAGGASGKASAPAVTRRRLSANSRSRNTFVERHALDDRSTQLDQRLLHQVVTETGEPERQTEVQREVLQASQRRRLPR